MQISIRRSRLSLFGILLLISCTSTYSQDVPPQIRYREGQKGAVYAVATTSDGQSLLSAGVDGTVRVWDRETGLLVRTIPAHSATVLSLAVTPDGRRFASGGLNGVVNVFDVPSRNPLANITNVPGLAATLAVSPNGALVASGDNNPALRLWNAANNQHLRDFGGLTAPVTGTAFVNDGQFIIAATADGAIRSWTVSNGAVGGLVQTSPISRMAVFSNEENKAEQLLGIAGADGTVRLFRWPPVPPQTLAGHSDQVTAVTISHDGKLVATGGMDQLVNLDDAKTGKTIRALAGQPGKVASLAFSADDALLASGSDMGTIKFWNSADGADRLTVAGHTGAINALAFHPQAEQIASAGADGTVRIWRLPTTPQVLAGHSKPVASVAVTADGKAAATASSDKSIRIWSLADGKLLKTIGNQPQPITETTLSRDGKQLASGDSLGDLRVWDLTGDAKPALLGAHVGGVSGLIFDPKASLLYSSGLDGTVKSWNLPIAAPQSLPAMSAAVHTVALSTDGKRIVAAATDGSLQIIDRATGKRVKQIKASTAAVTGLSFSADGSLIAASDSTGTVTLWTAADGMERGRIAGHAGAVQDVRFDPKQNQLATAGADGTVRIWNTPTAATALAGHTKPVRSLTSNADGSQILTVADDGSTRLWDTKDGKPAATLHTEKLAGSQSAWSADGKQLATGNQAGKIRLFNSADGKETAALAAHQGAVTGLSYRPQNDMLATSGADGLLRIWKLPAKPSAELAKFDTAVQSLAVSTDGTLAVAGDNAKSLHVIDVANDKESALVKDLPGQVAAVAIAPDKSQIAAATAVGTIDVYPAAGGDPQFRVVGHPGGATSVAFHPQGKQLASVGTDGTLRVWDIAAAPKLLAGHTKPVTTAAVSPTGNLLATGSSDNSVRIWNLANGTAVRTISGHTAAITGLAWTADDARLASSSADKTARLWNVADGAQLAQFDGHAAAVNDVTITPDGATVVTASADKLVKVWNVAEVIKAAADKEAAAASETKPWRDFAGHTKGVNSVLLVANGATVVAGGADGSIRFWNVTDAKATRNLNTGAIVRDIAVSADGKLLAAAGEDKTIRVYNPADGKLVTTITGHAQPVAGVDFSRDNTRLLGVATDGTTGVWEVAGRLLEMRKSAGIHPGAARFGVDGKSLVLGGPDNSISLTPLALTQMIAVAETPVASVAWTPDGTGLVTGGADKTVKLWNPANGQVVRGFAGHSAAVTSVAVSPDGTQVLAAGLDKTARLWTTANAAVVGTLTHAAPVQSVNFSTDGTRIVTAADDASVNVWDVAAQQILQRFADHTKPVRAAAFAANGQEVLSGGDDMTVRRSPITAAVVVAAHPGGAADVLFLPKGEGVISAGADKRVAQYDLTGKLVRDFAGAAQGAGQLAVRADGIQLAAISADKQVYQWLIANGQLLRQTPVAANLTAIDYTPDGTRLLVGADDKQVRTFDPETGQLLERLEFPAAVTALESLSDSQSIAVSLADNSAVIRGLAFRRLLAGHTGVVNSVAWTADGKSLLSGGADKTIRHWNAETGATIRTLSGHTDVVNSVVVSTDMSQVISSANDKTVRLWTLANGAAAKSITAPAAVHGISLNADSTRLAGVGADGVVRVWDPAVGRELQRFAGHAGAVRGVSLSGDGKAIISGGDDKSVRLWPVAAASVIVADATKVHDLDLLPDGSHLVTAGEDRVVKLWDNAGQLVRSFGGSAAPVAHVSVSDDGQQIAAGGDPLFAQKNLLMWNTADAKLLHNIATVAGVTAVRFGSDGRVGVAGADKHLRVYSANDGRLLQDITTPATLADVQFVPGSPSILAAATDNKSYLYDYSLLQVLTGHEGAITGLAYRNGGKQLVTAGADNKVQVWNSDDGKVVSTLTGSEGSISRLVVTTDGKRIIAGRADKNVDVWDVPNPLPPQLKATTTFAVPAPVTALASDKTADIIAVGGNDNLIRLWSLKTDTEVERLAGHTGALLSLAVADDATTVFSGSVDKSARRWTPSLVDAATAHEGAVADIEFSSDGRRLFTAGIDKAIKSWETIGLKPQQTYTGMTGAIQAIAVGTDDKLLAAVGEEAVVRLWNTGGAEPVLTHELPAAQSTVLFGTGGGQLIVAGTDKIVRNFGIVQADGKLQLELTQEGHGHAEAITDLAVAADRHTLFSVGADKSLKRWYAASHAATLTSTESKGAIYDLNFSPDGTLLAGGSADKTVRVWDMEAGKLLHTLTGHDKAVSGVAFHPNGKELASTSHDGTIRLYSMVDLQPIDPTAEKPEAESEPADDAEEQKPQPPDRTPQPGLFAFTHGNNSFTGAPGYEVVSQLDLDWGKKAVNLGRVWVGTIALPTADKIIFRADTNPADNNTVRVMVGGELVIDGSDPKSAAEGRQGVLEIDDGAKRVLPIRVEFGHNGPSGAFRLLWSWEGQEEEIVPAAAFKHKNVYAGDLLYAIEIDDEPNALTFSPDGSWLIPAGRSRRWKWWSRANRQFSVSGDSGLGHNETIYGLKYNKAGSRIATIDYSGKLIVWNASNGQMLFHQQLPVSAGYAVAYTPDGTEIIVGTSDARVLRVLVPPQVR